MRPLENCIPQHISFLLKNRDLKNSANSALHIACSKGLVDRVSQLLLYESADSNAIDSNGWTPLHIALMYSPNQEMISILLKKGANINCKDIYGWTPLDIAIRYGFKGLADFLISKGAQAMLQTDQDTRRLVAIEKHTSRKQCFFFSKDAAAQEIASMTKLPEFLVKVLRQEIQIMSSKGIDLFELLENFFYTTINDTVLKHILELTFTTLEHIRPNEVKKLFLHLTINSLHLRKELINANREVCISFLLHYQIPDPAAMTLARLLFIENTLQSNKLEFAKKIFYSFSTEVKIRLYQLLELDDDLPIPFDVKNFRLCEFSPNTKSQILANIFFDKLPDYFKKLEELKDLPGLTRGQARTIFQLVLAILLKSTLLHTTTVTTLANIDANLKQKIFDSDNKADIRAALAALPNATSHNEILLNGRLDKHGTIFRIQRNKKNTYSLFHYDTGGVTKNYFRPKKGKGQAFFAIHNLLEETLLDDEFLDIFSKRNSSDLYKTLESLAPIEKRGVVDNEYILEPLQEWGTCSVMSYLALIRHKILTQNNNTKENYVQYKIFKGLFRDTLWKQIDFQHELTDADTLIYSLVTRKLATSTKYAHFAEIAQDPPTFGQCIDAYAKFVTVPRSLPIKKWKKTALLANLSLKLEERLKQEQRKSPRATFIKHLQRYQDNQFLQIPYSSFMTQMYLGQIEKKR